MRISIDAFCHSLENGFYLNQLDGLNGRPTYQEVFADSGVSSFCKGRKSLLYVYLAGVLCVFPFVCAAHFLASCIYSLRHEKRVIAQKKLFLFSNIALQRVASNAGVITGECARLYEEPLWKAPDGPFVKYSIYNLLTPGDLFRALGDSVPAYYAVCRKYGIGKSYSAYHGFAWFLKYYASGRIPSDVELFYCDHKNKIAHLIDLLPNRKNLIQHGTEILIHNRTGKGLPYYNYLQDINIWTQNLPVRQINVDRLYSFSEKEAKAMMSAVTDCSPEVVIVGYGTRLKKIDHSRPSVLIIGYYPLFYEKEKQIVESLQDCPADIYLKPHPLFPKSCYAGLPGDCRVTLIDGPVFPDVELVLSYDSTLALEYQALGKEVLFYDDFDISEVHDIVMCKLNL